MAKSKSLSELKDLAKLYGVEDNALFNTALETYALQLRVIERLRQAIDSDELVCAKSYVKGSANTYASPLIKELPRHTDAANKTVTVLLRIINTLGNKSAEDEEDELTAFLAMGNR